MRSTINQLIRKAVKILLVSCSLASILLPKDMVEFLRAYNLSETQKMITLQLLREWKVPYGLDMSIYEAIVKERPCRQCVDIAQGVAYFASVGKTKLEIMDILMEKMDDRYTRIDFIEEYRTYEFQIENTPFWGPKNAKNTLVVFSDYTCSSCKRFFILMKELSKQYPSELRIVFKHFFVSGNPILVKAGIAASLQGKYFEMAEGIYGLDAHVSVNEDTVMPLAEKIGLKMSQFKYDISSSRVEQLLNDTVADVKRYNVAGTPAVYFNGKKISANIQSIVEQIEKRVGK